LTFGSRASTACATVEERRFSAASRSPRRVGLQALCPRGLKPLAVKAPPTRPQGAALPRCPTGLSSRARPPSPSPGTRFSSVIPSEVLAERSSSCLCVIPKRRAFTNDARACPERPEGTEGSRTGGDVDFPLRSESRGPFLHSPTLRCTNDSSVKEVTATAWPYCCGEPPGGGGLERPCQS
jgi:hypothetical protein